jgi:uncharacterized protein (TIRG00374 family)
MPSFREGDRDAPRSTVSGDGAVDDAEEMFGEDGAPSFFQDPRRLVMTGLGVLAMFAIIYVALPNVIGLQDAIDKFSEGEWQWIAVAVGFNALAFAAYVALFRGVIGENLVHLDWRESYQITMAGLAASRLLSAGGAGGVLLSYWALRKAGMQRAEAARRMVAFLVVLYSFYVLAVIVCGVLLRAGVLPGEAPVSVTVVPAAIAGGIGLAVVLIALIPGDLQGRVTFSGNSRIMKLVAKLSAVPATISTGVRTALGFVRSPSKGGLAVSGAVGFWAANIGILWASFMAFGEAVPIGVIVMGFFVGMAANLAPDPAGVGAVDGGLIGAFVIFGLPASTVIAAVLIYRLIAFWLPLPPGIVAFLQLRRTVARWEREGRPALALEGGPGLPATPITSESKV